MTSSSTGPRGFGFRILSLSWTGEHVRGDHGKNCGNRDAYVSHKHLRSSSSWLVEAYQMGVRDRSRGQGLEVWKSQARRAEAEC